MIELRAHHDLGCLFIQYTGVLPDFRGQGLATALKHAAVTMGKARGLGYIRTVHHPDNYVAIAMNQRLGYRQATGSLPAPE